MKKINSIILIFVFLFLSLGAISQPPPPPGNPTVSGNTPVGAGAPIGNGWYFLLVLGAVYGFKKFNDLRNGTESEAEITE